MTQNELNRAVAEATGETVSEISSRGFGLLQLRPPAGEPATQHRGRPRRGHRSVPYTHPTLPTTSPG